MAIATNKNFGIDDVIEEIVSGEYVKDTLPNSAISFSGEHEAMYFSNLRKNLQSELAYLTIHAGQRLDDLALLNRMGVNET